MKKMLKLTAVALAVVTSAQVVKADSVNVHTFTPAANPSYIFTEDAILSSQWNPNGAQAKGRAFFSAFYDLINDPLVELNQERTKRTQTLVDSMNSLSLTFGYGLMSGVQIGAATAMSLVKTVDGKSQFGWSDSRVFSKFRLNSEKDSVVFAIMPELYIPTGSRSLFLSTDSVGGGGKLIAEHDFGSVTVAGNAGFKYHPRATFRDLNMRASVPLTLGMIVPIGSRWAFNADANGDISVPFNTGMNPSSVYGGFRYRIPSSDLVAAFGGAVGSLNGYSSADFRVIAGLTLMPTAKAEEPIVQKPAPAPVIVVKQEPMPVVSAVKKPARVTFTPKELVITEEVKFKHAKAELTEAGMNLLDEVAKVLKENKASYKKVAIEGHTNQLGSFKYNQKLSDARAATVKQYLVSKGIDAKALDPRGFGKTKPKSKIKGLSKEAALAIDRRVEFKVVQ